MQRYAESLTRISMLHEGMQANSPGLLVELLFDPRLDSFASQPGRFVPRAIPAKPFAANLKYCVEDCPSSAPHSRARQGIQAFQNNSYSAITGSICEK